MAATNLSRVLYRLRDLRARRMFDAIRAHGGGRVLDVGGGEFFETARQRELPHTSWTTVEPGSGATHREPGSRRVIGDGCRLPLRDASFDTVLSLQVLEHVLEPLAMVDECARVLRPGGRAIFLIPQTATLHLAPRHYQNFTRFWIRAALERAGLEIETLEPLGGAWSSIASRLVYFFLQSARAPGMSSPEIRRGPLFYALFPLMAVWALVSIPVAMLLSLGDLAEEPNNHLVVARKP